MATRYICTFDCGHKSHPISALPLMAPRTNTSGLCFSCWRNRRIVEVEKVEIPEKARVKKGRVHG